MKERLARMWSSLCSKFDSIYWCIVPYATVIIKRRLTKHADDVYIAMQDAIDIDDDVFKALDKLGFKEDDDNKSFVAVVARGKIAPNVTDKESVELDATVWFQDETRELDKLFVAYDLAGEIECYPTYIPAKDVVLFTMHPVVQNDLEAIEKFMLINKVVTWLAAIASMSVVALITTLCIYL